GAVGRPRPRRPPPPLRREARDRRHREASAARSRGAAVAGGDPHVGRGPRAGRPALARVRPRIAARIVANQSGRPTRTLRSNRVTLDSSGESTMRHTVIPEDGRESDYVAICPALQGCVSQGRTKRIALKNIPEAIEAYIEALTEDGLPVPIERGRETVEVEVAAR